jgi:PAS domain-containing protein
MKDSGTHSSSSAGQSFAPVTPGPNHTHKAVHAERQRLNSVLDMLPAYVILLSPDYHVPFANRFFEERFGKSNGKRCFEYLFNRTEPCEICETFTVLKTNQPHRWAWTGPDGRDYDIHDFPFTDVDGSRMIMEVGLDITEQKRAQRDLKAERQRLYDVLETLPAMICLITPDYRIPFANRSFREQFGEANGRRCYEQCFARAEPCEFCESFKVLETGKPHHWEVRPPGSEKVIAAHDYPITDADGSPLILEMDLDITAWRQAEAALKETNDKLERRVAERTLALQASQERLESDLAALTRMHALSGRLLESAGIEPLLQEVMDTAVAIMSAPRGTLQLIEGDSLRIVAHHGHQPAFLDFFASAENRASVCGDALRRGRRVVVADVESSPLFAGTPSLPVLREAGVRAVQSTPMTSRTGAVLGVLTTQWEIPHTPDDHDLWRIDLLVRQAADLIEHARAQAALRASNHELTRFNNAMVDRELRMVELKKEINALCARLGDSPPYPEAEKQ